MDWESYEEPYNFIWGLMSFDNLVSDEACLYSMNDIDIVQDKETGEYLLSIETAYLFESKKDQVKYLTGLLDRLEAHLIQKGCNLNELPFTQHLFMNSPENMVLFKADTVEELYFSFKIFVYGFTALLKELPYDPLQVSR